MSKYIYDYLVIVSSYALSDIIEKDQKALFESVRYLCYFMDDVTISDDGLTPKQGGKLIKFNVKKENKRLIPLNDDINNKIYSALGFVQQKMQKANIFVLAPSHSDTLLFMNLIPAFKAFGNELSIGEVVSHRLVDSDAKRLMDFKVKGSKYQEYSNTSDKKVQTKKEEGSISIGIVEEPAEGEELIESYSDPDMDRNEFMEKQIEDLHTMLHEDVFNQGYAIEIEDDEVEEHTPVIEEKPTPTPEVKKKETIKNKPTPVVKEEPKVEPIPEPVEEEVVPEPVVEEPVQPLVEEKLADDKPVENNVNVTIIDEQEAGWLDQDDEVEEKVEEPIPEPEPVVEEKVEEPKKEIPEEQVEEKQPEKVEEEKVEEAPKEEKQPEDKKEDDKKEEDFSDFFNDFDF